MSQWTHVAGIIRFDGMAGMPGIMGLPDLGRTCSFNDPKSKWDACTVPNGSEGSLKHSLWINPDEHSIAAYVVTVWGDLRDYVDTQEILDYFNRITDGRMVRQGCFTVDVSGQPIQTFQYTGECTKGKFTKV